MNPTAQWFFKTAIVLLIVGLVAGIVMAASGNHTIYSAHAHLNLLGFVVMSVYGCYFALVPAKATGSIPKLIWGLQTAGAIVMFPALSFVLLGNTSFEPIVAIASLAILIAAILFGWIVWRSPPLVFVSGKTPLAEI